MVYVLGHGMYDITFLPRTIRILKRRKSYGNSVSALLDSVKICMPSHCVPRIISVLELSTSDGNRVSHYFG